MQEAVGRDEVDAGVVRPAGEETPQHARGGRLASRHATGDGDHIGYAWRQRAEEAGRDAVELLHGGDVEIQQPGEGKVDLLHFAQRQLLVDAGQLGKVVSRESHRRLAAQARPRLMGEGEIG